MRNSTFSHCGDRTPKWSTCLLPRWAARVTVVHNWFHDCRGCDFIGGRIGPNLGASARTVSTARWRATPAGSSAPIRI